MLPFAGQFAVLSRVSIYPAVRKDDVFSKLGDLRIYFDFLPYFNRPHELGVERDRGRPIRDQPQHANGCNDVYHCREGSSVNCTLYIFVLRLEAVPERCKVRSIFILVYGLALGSKIIAEASFEMTTGVVEPEGLLGIDESLHFNSINTLTKI